MNSFFLPSPLAGTVVSPDIAGGAYLAATLPFLPPQPGGRTAGTRLHAAAEPQPLQHFRLLPPGS